MLSQRLADSTLRNAVHLEGLKAGEAREFATFLREMDRTLRQRLIDGPELTDYTRARLQRLIRATRADLATILDRYREEFGGRLDDLGEYASEFEAMALDQLGWESVVPAPSQVRAAIWSRPLGVTGAAGGKLLDPFLQGFTSQEADRLANAIAQGAYEGASIRQMVQRLRGTRANNYRDGLLAITSRNAEAISRTAIQHVSAVARMQTWQENDDIVTGYRWLSTLDGRTSTICRSLDGQVFKFDKGPMPPAHIRCRSTILAELDARYKLDAGGTRAARSTRTGKTVDAPAEATYYDWLKNQPAAFQDQVLGPARAKLLRDGGLTAKRFAQLQLDKNFTPLTLDEMRRLEPLAFEKAFGGKMPGPRGGGGGSAPLSPPPFVPAATVAEAGERIKGTRLFAEVAPGKLDISVMNGALESVEAHARDFPALRDNFGLFGSSQAANRRLHMAYIEAYAKRLYSPESKFFDTWEKAMERAKKRVKKPRTSGEWAFARWDAGKIANKRAHEGVMFNEKFGAKRGLDQFQHSLKLSAEKKFHPPKCDTIKSVMDHELGHLLDRELGVQMDERVKSLWQEWRANQELRDNLSGYAGENISEFVAEAWAEYRNNTKPRPISRSIGRVVEELYRELEKILND